MLPLRIIVVISHNVISHKGTPGGRPCLIAYGSAEQCLVRRAYFTIFEMALNSGALESSRSS